MADLRCSYWRPDPPDLENRAMGFFWGVDRDCLTRGGMMLQPPLFVTSICIWHI